MIEKVSARGAAYIDVLERLLDGGIVFDTSERVSLKGIDLSTAQTHVIVTQPFTLVPSPTSPRWSDGTRKSIKY